MNGIVLFLALCALGALCYWFYYKCVDWFEKFDGKCLQDCLF